MMKGQSTIETMLSIGVILTFVLILYSLVIYPRMDQTNIAQTASTAAALCNKISNAINAATYNGNGFSTEVYMPPLLSGKAYDATIYSNTIHLSWEGGDAYCPFAMHDIMHAGSSPPFNLDKTSHIVTNLGGVVIIE